MIPPRRNSQPREGYRYGGEVLAVLLSGVRLDSVSSAAMRVFRAVTGDPFAGPDGRPLSIRCSLGGAVLPGRAEDSASLVRAADDALLRAKREGKNRVCLA